MNWGLYLGMFMYYMYMHVDVDGSGVAVYTIQCVCVCVDMYMNMYVWCGDHCLWPTIPLSLAIHPHHQSTCAVLLH